MKPLGYHYSCDLCGTKGVYLTRERGVAETFHCPYDGTAVTIGRIVQDDPKKYNTITEDEILTTLAQL